MPLFALMAATGFGAGCVVLYFWLAWAGKRISRKARAPRGMLFGIGWNAMVIRRHLIAGASPPPTPFKIFVLPPAPSSTILGFTCAITIARLFRYFGVGFLRCRYGADAMPYLKAHWLLVAVLAGCPRSSSVMGFRAGYLRHKPHHDCRVSAKKISGAGLGPN